MRASARVMINGRNTSETGISTSSQLQRCFAEETTLLVVDRRSLSVLEVSRAVDSGSCLVVLSMDDRRHMKEKTLPI